MFRVLALLVAGVAFAGCASAHWQGLPAPRQIVPTIYDRADPPSAYVGRLTEQLVRAKPLPVSRVLVAPSAWLNLMLGATLFPSDNAGSWRCGQGDPPELGCLYVGDALIMQLSPTAMAGVIAHELGHLELGHRPTGALADALSVRAAGMETFCHGQAATQEEALARLIGCGLSMLGGTVWAAQAAHSSRALEHEADAAALARLSAAGFCASRVMQTTFAELSRVFPRGGRGGLLASHPAYSERRDQAMTPCDAPTAPAVIPKPITPPQPASRMGPCPMGQYRKTGVGCVPIGGE